MKVIYTDQSFESLKELEIFYEELGWSSEKILDFRITLLDKADSLIANFQHYQVEIYLEHLDQGHQRAIEGFVKIIYLVDGDIIYVTDFFDTRQDPTKMKG